MRTRAGMWCAGLAAVLLIPATPAASSVAAPPGPVDRHPAPLNLQPRPGRLTMMNGRGDLVGSVDGSTPVGVGEWRRSGPFLSLGPDDEIYLRDMNDRGHLIGDDGRVPHGDTLWHNGETVSLSMAGTVVWAAAVSNRDQVVGDLSVIDGPGLQAFSWQHGAFTRLPTPQGWSSYAVDVNDRGQVLGMLADSDWSSMHGAVWDHGRLTVVGELNGPDTSVRAINNRGQVIGISDGRPFLWADGRMRDLLAGTDATTGYTRSINDSGLVTGEADFRPVVWTGEGMRYLLPAGYSGDEKCLNRRGDVAGTMYPGSEPDPQKTLLFRWRDGVVTYYGAPAGSQAGLLGMDEHGRLVGAVTSEQGVRQWVSWAPGKAVQ